MNTRQLAKDIQELLGTENTTQQILKLSESQEMRDQFLDVIKKHVAIPPHVTSEFEQVMYFIDQIKADGHRRDETIQHMLDSFNSVFERRGTTHRVDTGAESLTPARDGRRNTYPPGAVAPKKEEMPSIQGPTIRLRFKDGSIGELKKPFQRAGLTLPEDTTLLCATFNGKTIDFQNQEEDGNGPSQD